MDGTLSDTLSGLASKFLDQAQDLAFTFTGASGELSVISFSAQETINAPFEIHLELASEDPTIDLHALMDQSATLGVYSKYDVPRFLNGIVTDIERRDSGIRRTFYALTLRPKLVRLDHSTDSRHWQRKSVPDIVKLVLEEFSVTDVDWRLDGSHPPREFLVQYRETQRGFIERIMAEEGIFYFFEHSADSHKMVITDAPLSTPILPAAPEIAYNPRPGGQSRGSSVSTFHQRERLRSSAYQMNDYTFKNPPANMKQSHTAQEQNGLAGEYALYEYPGRYKDPKASGDPFTKHRMESARVDATTANGTTNNIQFFPGVHFTLTGHDDPKANGTHRLLSVSHSGTQSAALQEDAGAGPTTYNASFTCQPGRLPYRPPVMRKPMVDGPQIAIVTGPAGEEIYCDEHGRIKVWFPWDRYSAKDGNSSCWIRVSQSWAGGTWGHIAIPRIGHEVIVEYLEGDPDQPIITGRTYHATNKPAYDLPAHKTRMSIKSQTHKGQGFNELRFEDEADQEEVYMHAQKDHNTQINNNESHSIGVDRSKTVGNDQQETVGNDKTISVGNDHKEDITSNETATVGKNRSRMVGMNELINIGLTKTTTIGMMDTVTVGATQTYSVGMNQSFNIGKTQSFSAGADHNLQVGKNRTIAVGVDSNTQIGKNSSHNIGEEMTVSVGKNCKLTVTEDHSEKAGKKRVIEAEDAIVLRCGQAEIELKKNGDIRINGKSLKGKFSKNYAIKAKKIHNN